MSNPITVVGTIATDPKLIKTQSGVDLCTFRVASGDRRFDKTQQQWVDGETNWFGITTFRTLAEHSLKSFRKGERVIVTGKLRVRRWENGEKSGQSVDVEADAIGHDVRWGVSRFEKRTQAEEAPSQDPASEQNSGSMSGGDGVSQKRWNMSSDSSPQENMPEEGTSGSEPQTSSTAAGDGFAPVAA